MNFIPYPIDGIKFQHRLIVGNGFISTNTLKEILKELDNKLSEEDLENIIEEVDEDGSGTLDFDGKPC